MIYDSVLPDEEEPGSGALAAQLFPAGEASGPAFLDRQDDRASLAESVRAARHVWFDAPARFGKRSLINAVYRQMTDNGEPVIMVGIDLLSVHDERSLCAALLGEPGRKIGDVMRRNRSLARKLTGRFVDIPLEEYITDMGMESVRFAPGLESFAVVRAVLTEIDRIAAEHERFVIFSVEECQQIATLREQSAALATLAAVMADATHTTWIWSGGNRWRMHQLFGTAPLDALTRRHVLLPLDADTYRNYLTDATQQRWGCFTGRKAMATLLSVTQRHPLFLNQLCRRLWSADLPPVIRSVVDEWQALVADDRHRVSRVLQVLSPNQRAVLQCLAETPTAKPRARSFVARSRVSSASVGQAIKVLRELDVVARDADDVLRITDPVIQWYLSPDPEIVGNGELPL